MSGLHRFLLAVVALAPAVSAQSTIAGPGAGRQGSMVQSVLRRIASPFGLEAEFAAEPRTAAAPLQVQFSDRSTGLVSDWLWDFGDGNTSVARNPLHTYQGPGDYTVTLSVEGMLPWMDGSDSGRAAESQQTVSVGPTTIAGIRSVSDCKKNFLQAKTISTLDISPASNSYQGAEGITIYKNGTRLALANGATGIILIDISDLTNPVELDRSVTQASNFEAMRSVEFKDGVLFSCGRASNQPAQGVFEAWDVSNDRLVGMDYFQSNTGSPATNSKYSEFAIVGNVAFVSGQIISVESFDISDPANIVRLDAIGFGGYADLETQGLAATSTHVFFCNYATGGVAIRTFAHTNGVFNPAYVDTPSFQVAGTSIRPWHALIEGNLLYVSNNDNPIGANLYGGLSIYDITDPSQPLILLDYVSMPSADLGHVTAGDTPNLGIRKVGDNVFLANGDKGYAIFDVNDPTAIVYRGILGNAPPGENVMAVEIFQRGCGTYIAYGSGAHNTTNLTTFYIERLWGL